MNIEELIIRLYCCVAGIVEEAGKLRERGFSPGLTDAEVLTMEIVGELQQRDGDAAIWHYFKNHWQGWFPALGSYQNFAKHCANLRFLKERIQATLFPATSDVHIVDGVPMPLRQKQALQEFTCLCRLRLLCSQRWKNTGGYAAIP